MRGGSGLNGAIHDLAGPGLMQELIKVAPDGCETGSVVLTGSHNLPQKYILHAVGPIWGEDDEALSAFQLVGCYMSSMRITSAIGMKSIAFPSISTGIYGYPIETAIIDVIPVLFNTLMWDESIHLDEVVLALYGESEYDAFETRFTGLQNRLKQLTPSE